jgi:hypothetical protein
MIVRNDRWLESTLYPWLPVTPYNVRWDGSAQLVDNTLIWIPSGFMPLRNPIWLIIYLYIHQH